jgi:hypothetical protein
MEPHQFYLLLQNVIKCLKSGRVSSHPERLIGRQSRLLNGEEMTEGNDFRNDENFHLLMQWIWIHKHHLFCLSPFTNPQESFVSTSMSSLSYFQLSLLLNIIKEFKKVQSYQLDNFSFEFIFHWLSTYIPKLIEYLPNCNRLIDIMQATSQLLSKQFSMSSLTQYLEILLIFHYAILKIDSPIFPSLQHSSQPLSNSFVDSSSLLSGVGPALFSLHVESLCLILRQYEPLVARFMSSPTSSSTATVATEDLSSLMSLHNQLLSSFSHLLSSAHQHYQHQDPLLSSAPESVMISWNLISYFSENDKTLLSTLNLLEEVYVSIELFKQHTPEFFESVTNEDLFHRTALTFISPLNFSREYLLIYFCQCLCFDELTLLDLITHNETVGLQYFLRIVKYLDRAVPSDLEAACQVLTRKMGSENVQRGSHVSWDQMIQDYTSDTEEEEEVEVVKDFGMRWGHAAIWIKSEMLLSEGAAEGGNGGLETVMNLSHQTHFANNSVNEQTASIISSTWMCSHHSPSPHAVHRNNAQQSETAGSHFRNIFSDYSSTELLQKVLILFEEIEIKLEEMNTQQLLPFNATPLLRRLQSANKRYQRFFFSDREETENTTISLNDENSHEEPHRSHRLL